MVFVILCCAGVDVDCMLREWWKSVDCAIVAVSWWCMISLRCVIQSMVNCGVQYWASLPHVGEVRIMVCSVPCRGFQGDL